MIRIKWLGVGAEFLTCNACHSEEDVKSICIGKTMQQTVSIRLCYRCRKGLHTLLDNEVKRNSPLTWKQRLINKMLG